MGEAAGILVADARIVTNPVQFQYKKIRPDTVG